LEVYEENDLDAALARFEELRPQTRRLENAAAQINSRIQAYFMDRDWTALTGMLADDYYIEDRRRAVNDVLRQGRAAAIANLRAIADLGVELVTTDVIATRGARLALSRIRWSGHDQRPDAFHTEVLAVVETDAASCSTSTTSAPPSQNLMRGTSPAKGRRTCRHGQLSRRGTQHSTGTKSLHDTGLGKPRPQPWHSIHVRRSDRMDS